MHARDTLYEEELFYELVREARMLGPYGVTTRQNLIRFPVSEEQEVMLDLVDADQEDEATDESHDVLANSIGHSIRILLTFAHRQNLYRRTQPPPPISQRRRHTPEYLLLRPVLVYLQHNSHVRWFESFLKEGRTPGLNAKITNPSLPYVWAYCAVNMFKAALVILYAGPGMEWDCWEREMEPRDVDLFISPDSLFKV
jgi:hypothetical protein